MHVYVTRLADELFAVVAVLLPNVLARSVRGEATGWERSGLSRLSRRLHKAFSGLMFISNKVALSTSYMATHGTLHYPSNINLAAI